MGAVSKPVAFLDRRERGHGVGQTHHTVEDAGRETTIQKLNRLRLVCRDSCLDDKLDVNGVAWWKQCEGN
jgi:hypothetical protein